MSTIKSSAENLTLNADGASKDIKFQANGVEKASISSAGAFTSTTIDATKLTGNLPAISAASLTNVPAANITGTLPAISGANLTNLPAGGVDGIVTSANATAMTIDANENIGIGVTPTTGWDSGMDALEFSAGAISSGIENTGDDQIALTENAYYDDTNNRWQYKATGAASMIKMKNGQIDMLTAASGSADAQCQWNAGTTYPTTGSALRLYTPPGGYGSKVFIDTADANVGGYKFGVTYHGWQEASGIKLMDEYTNVNNFTIAAIGFHVGMNVVGKINTTSTSTSYVTSSDYRLKENVEPITGAINRLKGLKPSRFNFKIAPNTTVDGFLAHEVSDYVPEAISGEKDAMEVETKYTADDVETQGDNPTKEIGDAKTYSATKIEGQAIDQSKLVPLLVGALQEAVTKIETLETKVTALENA